MNLVSSTAVNLKPTAESSDSILNLVCGAPPNNSSNCPSDEILVGVLVRSFEPLLALAVYPIKAGIAVCTGTTEDPKELFSSIYTHGVANVVAICYVLFVIFDALSSAIYTI